jgi:hypothetical protein
VGAKLRHFWFATWVLKGWFGLPKSSFGMGIVHRYKILFGMDKVVTKDDSIHKINTSHADV